MHSYRVTVGDGRSTEELVTAGDYGYAHSCVTSEHFPVGRFAAERRTRERFGAYSLTSATAFGMMAPMPNPPTWKRSAARLEVLPGTLADYLATPKRIDRGERLPGAAGAAPELGDREQFGRLGSVGGHAVGRRKIWWAQARGGSIPPPGTNQSRRLHRVLGSR